MSIPKEHKAYWQQRAEEEYPELAELRREIADAKYWAEDRKADLDRIARAVYPDKVERFTYSVDFIIEELAHRDRQHETAKQALIRRVKGLEDALVGVLSAYSWRNAADIAREALAAKEKP